MKRFAAAAAVFLALAPGVAFAGETATLARPLAGASLNAGPLDLALYYVDDGATLDVVVTYIDDAAPGEPHRLVVPLADGDNLVRRIDDAAMSYVFARDNAVVRVDAAPTVEVTALRD